MKVENYLSVEFPSRSANEALARSLVACFAAQLDPTMDELTTGGEERSGMGFTIMESFMTSLRVTSKVGKGTTVHMKRKIVRRGDAS